MIASHSSVRAITNVPRNMSDDMIRALAQKGGVIHVNYVIGFLDQNYADARAKLSDQPEFQALLNALREQYRDDRRSYQSFDAQQKLLERYQALLPRVSWERILDHIDHVVKLVGVDHVGLGSNFDGATMPDGMNDASFLPRISQGLLDRSYKEEDIRKILGGNTLRVMEEVERIAAR